MHSKAPRKNMDQYSQAIWLRTHKFCQIYLNKRFSQVAEESTPEDIIATSQKATSNEDNFQFKHKCKYSPPLANSPPDKCFFQLHFNKHLTWSLESTELPHFYLKVKGEGNRETNVVSLGLFQSCNLQSNSSCSYSPERTISN